MYTIVLPTIEDAIPITIHPRSAICDFASDGTHFALNFDQAPDMLAYEVGLIQWWPLSRGMYPAGCRVLRGGVLFTPDRFNVPPAMGSIIFTATTRFDMAGQLG